MPSSRLIQQMQFILEIDQLKNVYRETHITDGSRQENSAEHSWHLAVMAMIFLEYAPKNVDLLKVLQMLLVHDLVEVYAGDTFCYDVKGNKDKAVREQEAAKKLFGMLPKEQENKLRSLWKEFEDQETVEAQFATALDRLQPLLMNQQNQGGTWQTHGITSDRVHERMRPVEVGAPALWPFVEETIEDCVKMGYLKPKPE